MDVLSHLSSIGKKELPETLRFWSFNNGTEVSGMDKAASLEHSDSDAETSLGRCTSGCCEKGAA